MEELKEYVYLVQICSDDIDDIEENIFVTIDEKKAKNWCKRYNHIITDNKERIFNFDENSNKKLPFWYYKITWSSSIAQTIKIELRNLK
jgi:hypothetical protein